MTLFMKCVLEFIGTMVLVLMGDGVCAATSLNKSKAKGAGWVVVAFGWGFAVLCGALIAKASGAHLNPALSISMVIAGKLEIGAMFGYIIAQLLGAFCGACLVYVFYKDHYDATEDADTKLGTFCTAPAVRNLKRNFLCEAIATWVLVFVILAGSPDTFAVTMLIVAIGMSLGGATGYAINPARDLAPRLAHHLLPIKDKRDSDWAYSWVPVAGPVVGAVAAALCFILIF